MKSYTERNNKKCGWLKACYACGSLMASMYQDSELTVPAVSVVK